MKKSDWQYLVDTLLFLCIVGITFIGILMGFLLPKGPKAQESAKYFLSLHRHQWGNIHFYLSIAFVVLVIIHLTLSWKWIKGKARQLFKKGWSTVLVFTAIGSFLVIFLFWILYPKVPGAYDDYGVGKGRREKQQHLSQQDILSPEEKVFYEEGTVNIVITGQTTLKEIEDITGISAERIAAELGLPSKTSPEETLGRLRKKYLFSLQETRDIISNLSSRKKPVSENREEKIEVQEKQEKTDKQEGIHTEEHEEKLTRGRKAEDISGILITGRMTLYDIEEETGVSAREIASKLGLPANTLLDETLGKLRKKYSFTMQDVRDTVALLAKKK